MSEGTETLKITYRFVNKLIIAEKYDEIELFLATITNIKHKRMILDTLKKVRDEERGKVIYYKLLEEIETELGQKLY